MASVVPTVVWGLALAWGNSTSYISHMGRLVIREIWIVLTCPHSVLN
jgi:hypothetical protein